MIGRVRVLVYVAAPGDDPGAVERAYHQVSGALAGTPGLLGNVLLRDEGDKSRFIVMSEWESAEAFQTWERGAAHKGTTAPLRPYQDVGRSPVFGIYQVTAAYS
ncbi:antibiotic biosynthesis monooxygenase family protein [Rhizohabitans arisaemae]|uniref:antibiotic biosynthesis monooxygenase family protein n=1 Tax=Rhizohabitans arisaemae TaxID=2720610 RepID=UPI0024B17498|nr:antibiotic biosynthesis monooxygenase [Rhizohabitans arisaemae]